MGEYFPVQFDIGFFQLMNQFAVFYAIGPGAGVDLDVPKRPVIPFLLFSAAESVRPSVKQSFLGGPFFGFPAPFKALGIFEERSPFFGGNSASFNSRHIGLKLFFLTFYQEKFLKNLTWALLKDKLFRLL